MSIANPLAVILRALSDAIAYRLNHPDQSDMIEVNNYQEVTYSLNARRIVVVKSDTASYIASDGTLALAVHDIAVFAAALRDGAEFRIARASRWCPVCRQMTCGHQAQDLRAASAYRAMADELS